MKYELKPVFENHYLALYQLIDKNRDRIKRDFPTTCKQIQSAEDAKRHLSQSDERRRNKAKYLLGVFDHGTLIAYINIKNIDWNIPKAELAYFIDEAYEGKGIMSEYLKRTIDYCFEELEIVKLFLRIDLLNGGSRKLAEKSGFILEGRLRKEFRTVEGDLIDLAYYGLIKT